MECPIGNSRQGIVGNSQYGIYEYQKDVLINNNQYNSLLVFHIGTPYWYSLMVLPIGIPYIYIPYLLFPICYSLFAIPFGCSLFVIPPWLYICLFRIGYTFFCVFFTGVPDHCEAKLHKHVECDRKLPLMNSR